MQLHLDFVDSARRHRKKMAFLDRTTGRDLTYGRALIGSLVFQRRIQALEDTYVGIMLPTSAGCGLAIIATLMAGRVPVMINYSTGAAENIAMARERTGLCTVITSRTLLDRINCPTDDEMLFVEDILASTGTWSRIRAAIRSRLPRPLLEWTLHRGAPDDVCVLLFTSGSEKEPKGVELTHRSIGANLEGVEKMFSAVDEKGVMLAILPLFHVFGFSTTFWLPIHLGQTVVTYANPLEFRTVVELIRTERPTILVTTPYFLMNYHRVAEKGDFDSLELVVAGADKTPEWLHKAFHEEHGLTIIEGYGTTETSPVVSVNPAEAPRVGSVGVPIPGVEVRIVDVDSGAVLGSGHEGKIQVSGDVLMKGYFNDMESTMLKIEDGWYETGDMGLLDEDGYLWHRGRLRRFVKVAGEMVSLTRVEEATADLIPDDAEVCAVEIPDARRGASIALAVTVGVDESWLRRELSKRLPAIAVPRMIVPVDELPKMGSGKVDFRGAESRVRALLKEKGWN
ncbi:MAG: AMP-binding protein [Pseudomonadota bacterium]